MLVHIPTMSIAIATSEGMRMDTTADVLADWYRYHTDPEWKAEKEQGARDATDGNVTYLQALVSRAASALARVREPR